MSKLRSNLMIVLALAFGIGQAVGSEPYRPRVGQPHIDFQLPSLKDGSAVRLSQFRGKKVLLIQFASW